MVLLKLDLDFEPPQQRMEMGNLRKREWHFNGILALYVYWMGKMYDMNYKRHESAE